MRLIEASRASDTFNTVLEASSCAWADLRLMCVEFSGIDSVLTGACILEQDQLAIQSVSYTYGPLKIHRGSIPKQDVRNLLAHLGEGTELDIGGLRKCHLQGDWGRGVYLGTGERYGRARAEWPCLLLEARLRVDNEAAEMFRKLEHQRLYGNYPLYPDVATAVFHQVFAIDDIPSGADYVNCFHVLLPDLRGRIQSATLGNGRVDFVVELGADWTVQPLLLDIYADTTAGIRHSKVPFEENLASFDTEGDINRLLAHLMCQGEIIDELEIDRRYGEHADPRVHPSPTQRRLVVEAAVALGEGRRV